MVFTKEWLNNCMPIQEDTQQLEVDVSGNNKWGSFPWLRYEQTILSIHCYRQNTLLPMLVMTVSAATAMSQ